MSEKKLKKQQRDLDFIREDFKWFEDWIKANEPERFEPELDFSNLYSQFKQY